MKERNKLTARQQMERKRLLDLFVSIPGRDRDDNRVSGIVPSSASRTDIGIGGQNIHELSFPFVPPLGPKHDGDHTLG